MADSKHSTTASIPPRCRRDALGLFASAAALALLPAAAIASGANPIFAAIDRHKVAARAFDAACALTDEVTADAQGRTVRKPMRISGTTPITSGRRRGKLCLPLSRRRSWAAVPR
jgi:hypothetical protein